MPNLSWSTNQANPNYLRKATASYPSSQLFQVNNLQRCCKQGHGLNCIYLAYNMIIPQNLSYLAAALKQIITSCHWLTDVTKTGNQLQFSGKSARRSIRSSMISCCTSTNCKLFSTQVCIVGSEILLPLKSFLQDQYRCKAVFWETNKGWGSPGQRTGSFAPWSTRMTC